MAGKGKQRADVVVEDEGMSKSQAKAKQRDPEAQAKRTAKRQAKKQRLLEGARQAGVSISEHKRALKAQSQSGSGATTPVSLELDSAEYDEARRAKRHAKKERRRQRRNPHVQLDTAHDDGLFSLDPPFRDNEHDQSAQLLSRMAGDMALHSKEDKTVPDYAASSNLDTSAAGQVVQGSSKDHDLPMAEEVEEGEEPLFVIDTVGDQSLALDALEAPSKPGKAKPKISDASAEDATASGEGDMDEDLMAMAENRYWGAEDPPKVCHRCGESGHSVKDCPHVQCLTCGKLDEHTTNACPLTMTCFRCGNKGHHMKDCTVSRKDTLYAQSGHECYRCGSSAHVSTECPSMWRIYVWRPGAPSTSAVQKGQKACYSCASSEHYGDDCPKPRLHHSRYRQPTVWHSDGAKRTILDALPVNLPPAGKMQRPNIVNGVRQPPPRGDRKGVSRVKSTLQEEVEDLHRDMEDDEDADFTRRLKRINGTVRPPPRGAKKADRWEPFKSQNARNDRGRDRDYPRRDRSPEYERRERRRSRSPPRRDRRERDAPRRGVLADRVDRGSDTSESARDRARNERKSDPRGPGGRQRDPPPLPSGQRPPSPPPLLDRVDRARDQGAEARRGAVDSYRPPPAGGGRYRGGYV